MDLLSSPEILCHRCWFAEFLVTDFNVYYVGLEPSGAGRDTPGGRIHRAIEIGSRGMNPRLHRIKCAPSLYPSPRTLTARLKKSLPPHFDLDRAVFRCLDIFVPLIRCQLKQGVLVAEVKCKPDRYPYKRPFVDIISLRCEPEGFEPRGVSTRMLDREQGIFTFGVEFAYAAGVGGMGSSSYKKILNEVERCHPHHFGALEFMSTLAKAAARALGREVPIV